LFTKRTDKHWWYLHAQWNPWSGDNMNEDKTTISQAQSYQAIGEFWDTHDLGEFWEQTAPAEFDVDIRSETTYFYVREAPDFEQWVLVQRAHFREAVLQGLHTLANWHEQQGDLTAAIAHTRRLLTLEPWQEEAHRQLMTRLARSGQRAAALAQFESCRQVLAEELAVEPDAETLALLEAIPITLLEGCFATNSEMTFVSNRYFIVRASPAPRSWHG
jgi:DNA-binding SARP family transcriptional activator